MFYALLATCLVLMATFIVVRVKFGGVSGLLTKTLASFAFLVLAIFGSFVHGLTLIAVFIILGLIFGFIGDIVLDLKVIYKQHESIYLNAGMLSFGLGHVMYLVATVLFANALFLPDIKTLYYAMIAFGIAGVISIVIALFGEKMLKLNFGKFKIQTVAYTFILSFMSAFSLLVACYAPTFFIFAGGITFIFISDLVLSKQYFGGMQDNGLLTTLNHAVYYLGQIAIASSLFFIMG